MMQDQARKQVVLWLSAGLLMVLMIVVVGGITRLTHSGLSIVTWQPVKGVLPPLNEAQWHEAFEAYKQIPQYKKVHHYFTLEDFKKIYFWEYFHRILGRLLGVVFFVFFTYFVLTRKIRTTALFVRLSVIFLLGGLQGIAGWYMVSSGLVENTSVDHVRLAIHLSLAMIITGTIFWTILELRYPVNECHFVKLFKATRWLLALVVVQIIYGALTAGLKAGYIFPTYPLMGTKWLPDIIVEIFRREGLVSLFDFPATVQFIHRWLGLVISLMIIYYFLKFGKQLPEKLRFLLHLSVVLVTTQFFLGVYTLVYKVPIPLAALHQTNAFLLFINLLAVLYFSRNRQTRLL